MINYLKSVLFKSLLLVQLAVLNSYAQQNSWEQTNGPVGGDVKTIVTTSLGTILAGGNGIFRSTNHGESWFRSNNGLTFWEVQKLILSPSGKIYAGVLGGVFCSTDDGQSWTKKDSGITQTYIYSLAVNPISGILLAGSSGGGVFRSSDNGNLWMTASEGLTNGWVFALAYSKNGLAYAGTKGDGFFVSTNNGISWTHSDSTNLISDIQSIGVTDQNHIFVGSFSGIFRSTDIGKSWKQVKVNSINTEIREITVNSKGELFAGILFHGIVFSNDNGNTWSEIDSGLTSMAVTSLSIDSSKFIYAGTLRGGIFKSSNDGVVWKQTNYINSNVNSFVVNSSGTIYAGTSYNGIFSTTDKGVSWKQSLEGLFDVYIMSLAITTKSNIFAGSFSGDIYRSTNNENVWSLVFNVPTFINSLIVDKKDNIFAGTQGLGIFCSTDGGSVWNGCSNGLRDSVVNCFMVTPSNTLFVGTGGKYLGEGGSIFQSSDQGNTWIETNNGLPNKAITSIVMNNNIIYASTLGNGVYYSTNNGSNWEPKNVNLTEYYIWTLSVDSVGNVFAGSWGWGNGVFVLKNETNNWINLSEDLNTQQVNTLLIGPDSYLYAGTLGDGVFKSVKPTTTVKLDEFNTPATIYLHQNYPNPFNPATTISFTLSSKSFVSLKIFDALGREVSTLVNEELSAGNQTRQWRAENVSSGIYFYQLKAGLFIETKKLLLLR